MAKRKLWIQTDLAYAATKEKLLKDRHLIGDESSDYEGKFSFTFKDLKDVTFQITTRGKVGIFYPENFSPKFALERLKPYLVRADGSPASIKHLIEEKMQTQTQDRNLVITVEEPIPILYALKLMEKYPIKEIRVKKSVWRRIRDFFTEPSIPAIEF
jgi:hypothetical protein